MGRAPGGFGATNVPLQAIIEIAYGDLKVGGGTADIALSGLPGWVMTDHYDIQAKPDPSMTLTPESLQQMLQTMLEDRFKLKVRRETKDSPVYALVLGKNGVKMKQSADQTPISAGGPMAGGPVPGAAPPTPGPAGASPPLPNPALLPTSGAPLPRGTTFEGIGRLIAKELPTSRLAELLTEYADRKVIDKTGLTALYDIDLSWKPERLPDGVELPPNFHIDSNDPDWFTAIQEQLGLRLVPQTAPVDSLLVEHIERPSDN
jgi:uncharacterized protein (TIGR03435 family)